MQYQVEFEDATQDDAAVRNATFCAVIEQLLQGTCTQLIPKPQGNLLLAAIRFTSNSTRNVYANDGLTEQLNAALHAQGFFSESVSTVLEIALVNRDGVNAVLITVGVLTPLLILVGARFFLRRADALPEQQCGWRRRICQMRQRGRRRQRRG